MAEVDRETIDGARAAQGAYPIWNLKCALLDLQVDEAFGAYRRMLDIDESVSLAPILAESLVSVARTRAKAYIESDPGGEVIENVAPEVLGDGNHRTLRSLSRTSYVACFENARVWGLSSCIELEGAVLFDFEDRELKNIDDQLFLDIRVFRNEGPRISYLRQPPSPSDMAFSKAFKLTGNGSRAFGHWMWEYLPKFAAALNAGCMPPMPVLIDAGMPPTHRDILERMLPPGFDLVEVPMGACVQVDEIWCAPSLQYMPLLEKMGEQDYWDAFTSPVERFLPAISRIAAAFPEIDPTAARDRRIFLARRPDQHRKLVNQTEIETLARECGFEIVYAESLSIADQVAMVRGADYILGPEGSAMFLGYFAYPGTSVAILNHTYTVHFPPLTSILEGLGLKVTVVTGPIVRSAGEWTHFSDYEIDPTRFRSFLNAWLQPR